MKKKCCIIFSRVSSASQEYTQQTIELQRLAGSYGYLPENQYVIEEKESGISLSEEDRLGLNRMKELIRNHQVDCVFCREVSRLARTKKVLFSVQDFLLHNNPPIQLIILEPRIQLLNEDGTVNDSAEIVFTLFAQQAESEMRIKKIRFREGKLRCRASGKWDGTPLPVGYSIDAAGFVIVDASGADIVRSIFDMYATGEWSTTTLAKELNKRGITINGSPINQSRVSRILMCERYCGEDIYPKIISRELFEAVKQLRVNARVLRKNNYASKCLSNRLIVCPECGRHYTASTTTYRCYLHHENGSLCHNNIEISITLIDDIVWLCARDLEVSVLLRQNREKVVQYQSELQVIESKKKAVYDKLSKYAQKIARVQDMYIDNIISKEDMKKKMEKIDAGNIELQNDLNALNNDADRLQSLLSVIINSRLTVQDMEKLNNSLPESIKKKREIVRTHIKEVRISEWKYKNVDFPKSDLTVEIKRKRYMNITVIDKYGFKRTWVYYPKWSFGKSKIMETEQKES